MLTYGRVSKLYQNSLPPTRYLQTNILDVTFNLKSKKYCSFREPNDQPVYNIHKQSNQPPAIKKQLLSMLSNRYLSFRGTRKNAKANILEDYNMLTTQAPVRRKENETSCGLIPHTARHSCIAIWHTLHYIHSA